MDATEQIYSIQIPERPHPIRNYLSSVTSEKSASCESCAMNVMNASCANNAHLHPFVHSKAAPGSVIVPAQ